WSSVPQCFACPRATHTYPIQTHIFYFSTLHTHTHTNTPHRERERERCRDKHKHTSSPNKPKVVTVPCASGCPVKCCSLLLTSQIPTSMLICARTAVATAADSTGPPGQTRGPDPL